MIYTALPVFVCYLYAFVTIDTYFECKNIVVRRAFVLFNLTPPFQKKKKKCLFALQYSNKCNRRNAITRNTITCGFILMVFAKANMM